MANYKLVKGSIGTWNEGDIVTDDDLKKYPNLGGVARLRDKLGVIEDTTDEPSDSGKSVPPELASGNPVGVNEIKGEGKAGDDPNARIRRQAAGGKS